MRLELKRPDKLNRLAVDQLPNDLDRNSEFVSIIDLDLVGIAFLR